MRRSLIRTVDGIDAVDLRGNSKKEEREVAGDGSKYENVFEVAQGVWRFALWRRISQGRLKVHRQRVYVDTSVIGGCRDAKFAFESRALIEMARRGELALVLSDLLFQELEDAPPDVVAVLADLSPDAYVLVSTTDEAELLRQQYMAAKILPPASEDDALHVAIATVCKADLIVSWNFKHFVHVEKIRQFNAVNLVEGYQSIDIRSPREVVSI